MILRRMLWPCFVLLQILAFWTATAGAENFTLIPYIDLKEEYNSNVFFRERNTEHDYISTLLAGIETTRATERCRFRFNGFGDRLIYLRDASLNSYEYGANGSLRYQIAPRLSTLLEGSYRRDASPDSVILETGMVTSAQPFYRQHYLWSGDLTLGEKTVTSLSYGYDRYDYEVDRYANLRYQSVNLGLTHDVSSLVSSTIARTNAGYAHYVSSDSVVDNCTYTVGASHAFNEKFSCVVDLGVRYTTSEFDVPELVFIPPFFGFVTRTKHDQGWGQVGNIVLTYQGELTQGNFRAFRDIAPAYGSQGTSQRTAVTFDVSRRFSYKLRGILVGGYYKNKSDRLEFSYRKRDDDTFLVSPKLRYDFNQDFSVESSYRFGKKIEHDIDDNANQNIVFLRLVYRYPLFEEGRWPW